MNEPSNQLPLSPVTPVEPKPRSVVPLVLLIVFAPALFCGLQAYQYTLWTVEQSSQVDATLHQLADAGKIGMTIQAVILTILTGLLWGFIKDERFRPVFAGWFGASLVAFPAILLRFLGPNNDQTGMLIQSAICVLGAGLVWQIKRDRMAWNWKAAPAALMIAALGIYPLVTNGALGSLSDFGLALLTGLCFGLFASLLFSPTTGNVFSDALGIAGVLALLASALGYDGGQLILLSTLPLFAFAIAALMPSLAGATILTGLVTAASLAFIDPTELSLLLGDFTAIGLGMAYKVLGLGLLTGVIALIARAVLKKVPDASWRTAVAMTGAALLWVGVLAAYLTLGHRGFYGDRLFVIFKAQADLSDVAKIKDRDQRLTAAYREMTTLANDSQASIRADFDTFGVKYTPYYLVNGMEVQGGTLVRLYLMTRPEVDRVIPSPRLRPVPPGQVNAGFETSVSGQAQWNIKMIGADKVWSEFGVRGKGIVIGQSDSGADGSHPAIRDQYRGHASGDNNYNWFDPWNGTSSPNDEIGHGTHTLGTMLGKDGIGIAPEAQWIGCVNLDRNLADAALYLDCMQFMLAPFPQGGDPLKDGDPMRAAHVLNNSWGCPEIEGCDPNSLKAAVDNLRAAGIFVVVSAGNDGSACSTIRDPLSLYDSVFSVGAIDKNGNMADFSSRGPVTADGSGRMKPDIAAPGVGILSSTPLGTYSTYSGTSMAGPHVVGAIALLWSAVPSLIGDIDRTEQILIASASPYNGDRSYGCFEGRTPNAAYGYGILNVYEAVKMALGQ
jgi:subtilisin family serine protease